jgi:CBS domain-containing protein
MFSQTVKRVMEQEHMLCLTPQASVFHAARLMAEHDTGAVLVVDDDALLGIFTERDAVMRVLARSRDPQATTLAAVMTPSPVTVGAESTFGYALQLMHERSCRHLPVVENGRPIGIVSARNVMDPDMEEFVCESQRRVAVRR